MNQDHHEIHLENYITEKLVAQGWFEGQSAHYDQQRALYPEDVVAWIQATQPDVWNKLIQRKGDDAQTVLLNALAKALDANTGGTVNVLRYGIQIAGVGQIELSRKQPEDQRNAKLLKDYGENRLRVVRQLKYCPTREWAIDLVFFINGIPVATAELKTDFTQDVESAMRQYRQDRLPVDPTSKRKEPLLTYKRGAVVHFAMSDSDIRMTARLAGDNTYFLPFNLGNNGHAGNPARSDGEYPVAYFWEEVLQRQTWLRVFHSFVYEEKQDKVNAQGKAYTNETLIFPRFHQLQAVNNMIADAKANGAGQQYLKELGVDDGFNINPEADYSEGNMNPEMGSLDLRKAFELKEYRVMLVANKFQTGFNQPKLVAMYLDKKISGVEAVQTLSRLNRTYPGKDKTFVIDPAVILSAFAQYDDPKKIS